MDCESLSAAAAAVVVVVLLLVLVVVVVLLVLVVVVVAVVVVWAAAIVQATVLQRSAFGEVHVPAACYPEAPAWRAPAMPLWLGGVAEGLAVRLTLSQGWRCKRGDCLWEQQQILQHPLY